MHLKSIRITQALIIITLLMSFSAFAQAPNLLNYQGVARNTVGNPLPNQTMKLRLSVHDLLPSGAIVYSEIRQITTNLGGLFSVQIGSAGASSSTGTIAGVNWLVGDKFLQVELDPASNNNYLDIGTVQLVSVPYSFAAGSAATVKTNANLTGVVTSVGNATSIANGAITSDMIGTLNKSKVGLDLVNNTTDASKPISTATQAALDTKVDKVSGKDLSTNDYTTDEKTKLAAITGTNTGDQDLSSYATKAGVDLISSGVSSLLDTKSNIDSPVFTGTVTIPNLVAGTNQYPTSRGTNGQVLTTNGTGILTWRTASSSSGVPYTGATSSVNLGAYDLTVNGLTVGKGLGAVSTNTAIGLSALSKNTTGGLNTANGSGSLFSNTTGSSNTAIGESALYKNISGNNNIAIGKNALYSNTSGSNNTASGESALFSNTTGYNNTGIGVSALRSNTIGNYNTGIGSSALYSNTTGTSNTANGFNALYSNTSGTNNTAIGERTLYSNTTGGYNTAIGWNSLYFNTTGNYNTASGYAALSSNSTGYSNTATGVSALNNNTTGNNNTASGYSALYFNTTGDKNTAMGVTSLYSNTTGSYNTAIGWNSLFTNTSGVSNTASGYNALSNNTTGNSNTATGVLALNNNTTGGNNTASGTNALFSNTTGIYNTASGSLSLYYNTGSSNTTSGANSLYKNTTGDNNTASGYNALYENTTGSNNTAVGQGALITNATGSNNTAIGYNANVASNSLYNATAIGYNASVTASNTIQLGNTSVTNVKTSGTLTAGTVTYPNAHGTSGQVLSTTGSGTLAWTTVSGGGISSIGSISGTSNANGGTISGTSLTLTPADGTNGGIVTSGVQTFAGAKTFNNDVTAPSFIGNLSGNAATATTAGNITATTNTTLTSLSNLATVGTITSGVWSGTTIAIANGGTGSTTKNFVDLTTNQNIGGAKQFDKAATNTSALNAGTSSTIDFAQSNLAYTSYGGATPGYTLTNMKNGGAYTLVLTSTTNSGSATFIHAGFTIRYMGTWAMTSGKHHIYSFIVIDTVIYVTMATEN